MYSILICILGVLLVCFIILVSIISIYIAYKKLEKNIKSDLPKYINKQFNN